MSIQSLRARLDADAEEMSNDSRDAVFAHALRDLNLALDVVEAAKDLLGCDNPNDYQLFEDALRSRIEALDGAP